MEGSVIFVFGEMTRLKIKLTLIVCSSREWLLFGGCALLKRICSALALKSSCTLGPGEGSGLGQESSQVEASICLGIIGTQNECYPTVNSRSGQDTRMKAHFMEEIIPSG